MAEIINVDFPKHDVFTKVLHAYCQVLMDADATRAKLKDKTVYSTREALLGILEIDLAYHRHLVSVIEETLAGLKDPPHVD
jgi:hypothetical protein